MGHYFQSQLHRFIRTIRNNYFQNSLSEVEVKKQQPVTRPHKKYTLQQRITYDLQHGNIQMAINRILGSFKHMSEQQTLHLQLAALYDRQNNLVAAGKHYYFKPDKTPHEQACMDAFSAAFGNDPLSLLTELIPKYGFSIQRAEPHVQHSVWELIHQVKHKHGHIPGWVEIRFRYLKKKYSEI